MRARFLLPVVMVLAWMGHLRADAAPSTIAAPIYDGDESIEKIDGFDVRTCYSLAFILDDRRSPEKMVLLRRPPSTGPWRFEIVTLKPQVHGFPITFVPPDLPSDVVLRRDPNPHHQESSELESVGADGRMRVRYGYPLVDYIELVRAMAAIPESDRIVDACIWKNPTQLDGAVVARHRQYKGLYTAHYFVLADTATPLPKPDPVWDSYPPANVRHVKTHLHVMSTSLGDCEQVRAAIKGLAAGTTGGGGAPYTIISLGSQWMLVPKASNLAQNELKTLPGAVSSRTWNVRSLPDFGQEFERWRTAATVLPETKQFLERYKGHPDELYGHALALSALSAAEAQAQMREMDCVQHPNFVLIAPP